MRYRVLGHTGLRVSQLGDGRMGLRGPKTWGVRVVDEPQAERVLNAVLDAGINFIDTSPDYGLSEERIGRYLGHRRDQFYLATKCGCVYTQLEDSLELDHQWRADVVASNIETSLRRLRTDHLDLLQFHGGDAQTLKQSGLIDLLLDYRHRGIIAHIGVSTSLPQLPAMIELGVFETFQVPFSCLAPQHLDPIREAASKDAGIILRGGIGQGGPEAAIQRPELHRIWQQARLDSLCHTTLPPAELILRYTLGLPECHTTIVGTCDLQHLAENVAAAERGPLSDSLQAEITRRVAACRTLTN